MTIRRPGLLDLCLLASCCILTLAAVSVSLGGEPGNGNSGVQADLRSANKDSLDRTSSQHWAYRPLQSPTIPAVENDKWPWSPIDSFVLARLERAGLQPSADTQRRTLVRRLYFQLIGLPPTAEQTAEFLADDAADAVERLVDRLLASRHFGERWGRHWLDLARYADSNGLDENFLFREAWRYRNWVVDAINDDKPFDRFLLEQIAGDLLPFESIEQRDRQRIAAGFLVVGPKVLLGVDAQQQRLDVAAEQVDTIGRAVLGQTLGCAKCHDHKFDPIPTSDYYALAGIFTSTEVMETRYMLGEQRRMERLAGLGSDGDDQDEAYEHYWRTRDAGRKKLDRARRALELLEQEDADGFDALLAEAEDGISETARAIEQPLDARLQAQSKLVEELEQTYGEQPEIPPRAMIPKDAEKPRDEKIRIAGRHDEQGEQVPRGFLTVVSKADADIAEGNSGRVELARWLTDADQGAGQLTARVLANRVWHHLLGRGIVRTVDNFGATGEAPTHPELLDYLAGELIGSDWSVKSLVRKIVLSRTFGMSGGHEPDSYAVDPENRLLWRAHRRRLDAETLRDAMLSAAGLLDLKPMDSTVWYLGDQATAVGANDNRRRTDFQCRSLYLPIIRNDLPELLQVFNFADPHRCVGARPRTMVATQGLYVLNDQVVINAAEATAKRLLAINATDVSERVDRAYELILGSPPTDDVRDQLAAFIEQTIDTLASQDGSDVDLRAWTLTCHALFASSRFQFLE